MDYQEIKVPVVEDIISNSPKAAQIQQVYAPASFADAAEITLTAVPVELQKLMASKKQEVDLSQYLTLTHAVTGEKVPYSDIVLQNKTGVYVNPQPSEGDNDVLLLNISGKHQDVLFNEMSMTGMDTDKFKGYYDDVDLHQRMKNTNAASPAVDGYQEFNYINLARQHLEVSRGGADLLHSYMNLNHEIGHKHIHQENSEISFKEKALSYNGFFSSSPSSVEQAYERGEGHSLQDALAYQLLSSENYSVAFAVISGAQAIEGFNGGREIYDEAFEIEKEMRRSEMNEQGVLKSFNTHYVYPSLMSADAFVQENFGKLSGMSSEDIQKVSLEITRTTLAHPLNSTFINNPENQVALANGSTVPMRSINGIVSDVMIKLNSPDEPKVTLEATAPDDPKQEMSALRMHR